MKSPRGARELFPSILMGKRDLPHVFHCVMGLMGFYWVTLGYEVEGVPQLIPQ